ncbi:MAG: hypothetical protein N2449_01965 [Bacteroidales bacterium]|nr:hypothetical protein [Bacteroidales bacterium]
MQKFFLVLLLTSNTIVFFAQKSIDEKISFPMISSSFMIQIPGADMATQFGTNANIGGSFLWKLKNNFIFELNANHIFGSKLKGDAAHIFDSIKTSNGMIINMHGEYAKVRTFERGFFVGFRMGYIINFKKPNPNSGLMLMMGAGHLQHKIRIENDGNNAPQIINEYKLGYDKMRYGLSLSQFIGYVYFSKSQVLNFYIGTEFYQAWTKSGRSWDFNLMKKDENKYFDVLYSLKFGWIIPIYSKAPQQYYFY